MFTAAAVPAAITLHSLGVAVLRFAFHPDMAQLPSSMADVIALIFTYGTGHVIALPDIFLVCTGFPFLMILELNVTP